MKAHKFLTLLLAAAFFAGCENPDHGADAVVPDPDLTEMRRVSKILFRSIEGEVAGWGLNVKMDYDDEGRLISFSGKSSEALSVETIPISYEGNRIIINYGHHISVAHLEGGDRIFKEQPQDDVEGYAMYEYDAEGYMIRRTYRGEENTYSDCMVWKDGNKIREYSEDSEEYTTYNYCDLLNLNTNVDWNMFVDADLGDLLVLSPYYGKRSRNLVSSMVDENGDTYYEFSYECDERGYPVKITLRNYDDGEVNTGIIRISYTDGPDFTPEEEALGSSDEEDGLLPIRKVSKCLVRGSDGFALNFQLTYDESGLPAKIRSLSSDTEEETLSFVYEDGRIVTPFKEVLRVDADGRTSGIDIYYGGGTETWDIGYDADGRMARFGRYPLTWKDGNMVHFSDRDIVYGDVLNCMNLDPNWLFAMPETLTGYTFFYSMFLDGARSKNLASRVLRDGDTECRFTYECDPQGYPVRMKVDQEDGYWVELRFSYIDGPDFTPEEEYIEGKEDGGDDPDDDDPMAKYRYPEHAEFKYHYIEDDYSSTVVVENRYDSKKRLLESSTYENGKIRERDVYEWSSRSCVVTYERYSLYDGQKWIDSTDRMEFLDDMCTKLSYSERTPYQEGSPREEWMSSEEYFYNDDGRPVCVVHKDGDRIVESRYLWGEREMTFGVYSVLEDGTEDFRVDSISYYEDDDYRRCICSEAFNDWGDGYGYKLVAKYEVRYDERGLRVEESQYSVDRKDGAAWLNSTLKYTYGEKKYSIAMTAYNEDGSVRMTGEGTYTRFL